MTTHREFEQLPTFTTIELVPLSSDPDEGFLHPVLEMFKPEPKIQEVKKPRLYLVPSTFGEEFDSEFAPQPTSASELPEIQPLIFQFIHNTVEIWAGRRSPHSNFRQCATTRCLQSYRKVQDHLERLAESVRQELLNP